MPVPSWPSGIDPWTCASRGPHVSHAMLNPVAHLNEALESSSRIESEYERARLWQAANFDSGRN
ncbi:MAG: hypothetical protein MK243_09645 [Gemmatimonadetes bacterium]|nr:hypothetical protein [Gemmatimonadota bacterium]